MVSTAFPAPDVVGVTSERTVSGRPSYSIWRRTVIEEIDRLGELLDEAETAGAPYDSGDYLRQYPAYLAEARRELDRAWKHVHPDTQPGWSRYLWMRAWYYLLSAWTGSETEAAWAALHRAEGLSVMVVPDAVLRVQTLELETTFREARDVPVGSRQFRTYDALFARVAGTGADQPVTVHHTTTAAERGSEGTAAAVVTSTAHVSQPAHARVAVEDRVALRHLRGQQSTAWEVARSRARIFRNILTAAIPFLILIEVLIAVVSWRNPGLIPLRVDEGDVQSTDAALVMTLGAFGGLLSAVSSVRMLRGFQRAYGLPLAQTLLKVPAGAATAFAGIFILQQGLFGSVQTTSWAGALPYALLFGIAQLSVTRKIDSRAADLLGDVNAKSTTSGSTSTSTTISTGTSAPRSEDG